MNNKYGYQEDKIDDSHYFLGSGIIETTEINPGGDWSGFLPNDEIQNVNGLETMNCTSYGTLNAIETLLNFSFKDFRDFSERYIGILAGTSQEGNSPHKVAETIRSFGLINELDLPFDEKIKTWGQYYSPKPMRRKYIKLGKEFTRQYDFKHEWVFTGGLAVEKRRMITEAIKRGPVCFSVFAWASDSNGIFYKDGPDNHWVFCYGLDEKGYKIFDTYDQTHKVYSYESDIGRAKLYWIKKKDYIHRRTLLDIFRQFIINWV